jgi:glycosyltransferase involved in cell wall biosynthesis
MAATERANLNDSRGLTCTAEQEIEEARPLHLRPPSIVLPCGIQFPPLIPDARERLREKYALPKDRRILLFLSRLHPKKGVDLLLDAVEKMDDLDFTLIAAGSGEPGYERSLRARIQTGPLAGRVLMPGFAEGADKDLLLQGSDVFALTSHSESFAIAVLEAMSVGLPSVISSTIPLEAIIKKYELGAVTNLEPSQIATALRAQLQRPPDKARRDFSRDLVRRNFTWDIIARRSLEVYEAALQHKPIPSWELAAV